VDVVQLSWNKKTINANNCHTANGDEIHSVQFYQGTGTVKITCEPSTCTVSSVMLNLKQPNIHNSNGDICTGYSWCLEFGIV